MTTAKQHYDALLADVYQWYVSAGGDPYVRAKQWLQAHDLLNGSLYLDLGAGFGAHVQPLLEQGKTVSAVDFSATLLAQLQSSTKRWADQRTTHQTDMLQFLESSNQQWDVILCLGDTLTHLPDVDSVRRLLVCSYVRLPPGGTLAMSYRDTSDFHAESTARFIPVAQDKTRSLLCLLEPLDAKTLRVTDIVTEVEADSLQTRVSDYLKLRLAAETLVAWANDLKFDLITRSQTAGLTTLVFRK